MNAVKMEGGVYGAQSGSDSRKSSEKEDFLSLARLAPPI